MLYGFSIGLPSAFFPFCSFLSLSHLFPFLFSLKAFTHHHEPSWKVTLTMLLGYERIYVFLLCVYSQEIWRLVEDETKFFSFFLSFSLFTSSLFQDWDWEYCSITQHTAVHVEEGGQYFGYAVQALAATERGGAVRGCEDSASSRLRLHHDGPDDGEQDAVPSHAGHDDGLGWSDGTAGKWRDWLGGHADGRPLNETKRMSFLSFSLLCCFLWIVSSWLLYMCFKERFFR